MQDLFSLDHVYILVLSYQYLIYYFQLKENKI